MVKSTVLSPYDRKNFTVLASSPTRRYAATIFQFVYNLYIYYTYIIHNLYTAHTTHNSHAQTVSNLRIYTSVNVVNLLPLHTFITFERTYSLLFCSRMHTTIALARTYHLFSRTQKLHMYPCAHS